MLPLGWAARGETTLGQLASVNKRIVLLPDPRR